MESMAFLGAFSGVWFALFLLIFIASGIFSVENDSFFGGTITFVLGLAGMDLLFGVPVWETLNANWLSLFLFLAIYIAAGSAYAGFWKWIGFIQENEDSINEKYLQWAKAANKHGEPDDFETYLNSDSYKFKAKYHKERLAAWVLMWPFGLLWDLMHRPARWVFNTVYENLGTMFDSIGKNTARKMRAKTK